MITSDDDIMPFGKYKGERLGDVPADYLIWFAEQDWCEQWPDLVDYVNRNMDLLERERRKQ